MRHSELLISAALMGLSVLFMVYAARLPIGWEAESGPGGGAFPFWLSLVMFLCAAAIFGRELVAGRAGLHHAAKRFFDTDSAAKVAAVAVSLVVCIALIPVLGVYGAAPLMMIFQLRFLGRQAWSTTLILALAAPVVLFLFFEAALRILLPKGWLEPLFIPLYALVF